MRGSGSRGRGSSRPAVSRQPPKPPTPQSQLPPKKSQPQQPKESNSQPELRTSIPRAVNQDKVGSPAQIIIDNTQRRRTPQQKQEDDRKAQLQAVAAERVAREKEAEKRSLLAAKEDELRKQDIEYKVQGIRPDLHTPECTYLHSVAEVFIPFPDKRYYLLAIPDNGADEQDEEEIELPAETVIDTESEGGHVNADGDDEDGHEESYGDPDYSPMDDSDGIPVAEYGDDDFAVCPIPNLNLQFTYLCTFIEAAVEASQEKGCK